MHFSFKCPAKDCNHQITIESSYRNEAVEKIIREWAAHQISSHPGLPLDELQMREIIQRNLKQTS